MSPPLNLETHQLRGHTREVCGIAFSPDSRLLVTSSYDATVRVWDAERREELRCFVNLEGHPSGIAFSHDGRILAASTPTDVFLWDVATGKIVSRFSNPEGAAAFEHLHFSVDGSTLAAATAEDLDSHACTKAWNLKSGAELAKREFDESVFDLGMDPTNQIVADTYATSEDQDIRIFRRRQLVRGDCLLEIDLIHARAGGYPVVAPNAALVALGHRCYASGVEVIECSSARSLFYHDISDCFQPCLSFSPDSTMLACSSTSIDDPGGCIWVWDAIAGSEVTRLTTSRGREVCCFSPRGRLVVAVSRDDCVAQFWDLAEEKLAAVAAEHSSQFRFSPDGRWFVSLSAPVAITDLRELSQQESKNM